MKKAPVHYIRLRTICYTTEKKQRVREALSLFLPENKEIKEEKLEGNFGNAYFLLKSEIEKSQQIRDLINNIKENLGNKEYEKIRKEIPERINEECSFYLRFDKQKAYKEELKTTKHGDAVVLRIKVAAYPAKKENAIEKINEFLF